MRRAIVTVLVLAAFATVPASAPAGISSQDKVLMHSITLSGSGGWKIRLDARLDRHQYFVIHADKGNFHALYQAKSKVTTTGFATKDWGQFAKVDLKLTKPRSSQVPVSRAPEQGKCTARKKATKVSGTYKGTIRFRADGGYTSVSVTNAKGAKWLLPARTCSPDGPASDEGDSTPTQTDRRQSIGCCSEFTEQVGKDTFAYLFNGFRHFRTPNVASFVMSVEGEVGNVSFQRTIDRIVTPTSRLATEYARDRSDRCWVLTRAVFAPPAPFSGSAVMTEEPASNFNTCIVRRRWSGDLAFRWPGLPPAHLGTGRVEDQEFKIPSSPA